jgi:quinol monooxygenase YgiN
MVQLMLTLRVPTAKVSAIIGALRAVATAAQWAPGWLQSHVSRDVDESSLLHYLEEWLTDEDAAREVRSARFCRLLELMETAAEPPDLQFRFVPEVRGLDYVAVVRGNGDVSTA